MGIRGRVIRLWKSNLKNISVVLVILVICAGIGGMLLDVYGSLQWIGENMCVTYYFFNASYFGVIYLYILPSLAVIPFSVSQCMELASKMHCYIIPKVGLKRYCFCKLIAAGVLGGLIWSGIVVLFVAMLSVRMPLINEDITRELVDNHIVGTGAFENMGIYQYYFIAVIRTFLGGFFWGIVALLLTAYTQNAAVVILSPYILGFVISRINRLLQLPVWMNLNYLFIGRYDYEDEKFLMTETVLIIVGMAVLVYRLYRKKIKELMAYV